MANVMIDIAAEFVGKPAFKQADNATLNLTKNVKKLAGAFGLAFGTTQVLAYGKAAVKAAAADEKAQKQLALALKNVGLGRDAASSEAYIQRLQSEFGIVDDLLRPAYQTLAVATRDSAESQRLLNLALDISASTGKDLGAVTTALSRAYLGNNTALTRLGVGISKTDLKTKSFLEVTNDLADTFKGSATEAANSLAGSMAKLEVASANVSEILGKGIVDSLLVLSGNTSVEELATDMETAATNAAAFLVTLSKIVKTINAPLMAVSGSLAAFVEKTSPFVNLIVEGDPSGFMKKKPKPFSTPMSISGQSQIKQQKEITKLTTIQSKNQAKITKDKKLAAAIDKANLALNKGSDVFDMDKIQIAAALTNQAQQLGKATDATQLLQIANDTARLNVKKAIFDLETAIASGDEAAITKATAKLNEELKILGALTGQKTQMAAIESILKGLTPKDLIDQKNLDEALRKIREMLALLAQAALPKFTPDGTAKGGTPSDGVPKGGTPNEIIKKLIPDEIVKKLIPDEIIPKLLTPKEINKILEDGGFVPIVPSSGGTTKGGSSSAGAYAASGFPGAAAAIAADAKAAADAAAKAAAAAAAEEINRLLESGSFVAITAGRGGSMGGSSSAGAYAASGFPGANNFNITVNTGVGDPNAIAEAISNVLREAQDRGTLTAV